MRGVALACVLSSAAAFLGGSPALKVRHAKSSPQIAAQAPLARSVALQMSSALAEESGVSLSSGGGMFTSSSPEDRRIGTELFVSGVRYRERGYPKLKRAHRAQRCAEASKASTAAPRGASAARGAPVTTSSAGFRRLAGARERSPIQRHVGARAPHTCDHVKAPTRRRRRRASFHEDGASPPRRETAAGETAPTPHAVDAQNAHRSHHTGTRPPRRTPLGRGPR